MTSHEAEAFVDDVEDAGGIRMPRALGLALEDAIDEVFLAVLRPGFELELAPDGSQLGDAHRAEIGDVEVVALARGLELLHLVVFGDGRAGARRRLSTARATITGTLVRTVPACG